jgi:hypothetical protein
VCLLSVPKVVRRDKRTRWNIAAAVRHLENQSRSLPPRAMDETLSSLYAKADTLRRQIDDGTFQGALQVQLQGPECRLTSRTSSKNAFPCLSDASSLSTNWLFSARTKGSMMSLALK